MSSADRPTVLLVGSGYEAFRRYLLEGVAAEHRVLLLNHGPVTWQWPFVVDARSVVPGDDAALLPAARELVAGHDVAGVLTWDEGALEQTARVAAHLGVPSVGADAVRACRDKGEQRALLEAAGVPSPRALPCASAQEARAAAAELGFPVVVKPRSLAGSIAVRVVHDTAELDAAYAAAESAAFPGLGRSGGVLVEELLVGDEVSVDCWALDGEVEPFVTARKTVGLPPYFEEVRHVVGGHLAQEDQVRAVARAAVTALGLDRVVAHVELMLTSDGPRIVEVNGRLGGDLIPYLGQLAGGPSAGAVAAAVATGRRPAPVAAATRWAGVQFLYPSHDMVFSRLAVDPAVEGEPWVDRLEPLYPAGATLRLPPRGFLARAGCAVVTADDEATLVARLDRMVTAAVPAGEPVAVDDEGAA